MKTYHVRLPFLLPGMEAAAPIPFRFPAHLPIIAHFLPFSFF
jgi:hypothetical protein